MWYATGTVSATVDDLSIVVGEGTKFINGCRVGDGITIQGSTSLHQVLAVVSDTQIRVQPELPHEVISSKFSIVPVMGYDKDLSDAINRIRLELIQYLEQLKDLDDWVLQPTADAINARDEAEAFRNETENFRDEGALLLTQTSNFRNETETFRNETSDFRNEVEAFKTQTSNFRNETETFRNETSDFRDEVEAFKTQTSDFRDETEAFRNETSGLRNETETFRNETSDFRDETETFAETVADTATAMGYKTYFAGEPLAPGDVVFIQSDNKLYKSSASAGVEAYGFVPEAVDEGTEVLFMPLIGVVGIPVPLVTGDRYWLGEDGKVVNTPPTAAGAVMQLIGTAISPNTLRTYPTYPIYL